MFTLLDLVQPDTIDEAYNILMAKRNNRILGGCAFLRLGSSRIATGVELSKLNLNYITEHDEYIEIGAMTTFRDIETDAALQKYFNGVIPKAVSNIIGVQFRNVVTVGASVYSRYGFSDLIPPLLAIDTEIELYKAGRMSLSEFLNKPYEKDILTKIWIRKTNACVAYQSLRNSASDFPLLNVAVSNCDDQWRIVAGATPARAKIAAKASAELTKGQSDVEKIANMAVEELVFGTNARGTAAYRKAVCNALLTRAIREVLQCK